MGLGAHVSCDCIIIIIIFTILSCIAEKHLSLQAHGRGF